MLVLTRKIGEKIMIGSNIAVTVVECTASRVRVGITAPRDVPVHRKELKDRINSASARTHND